MENNIKELIKYEYENGTSMSILSKKYNIGLSRIKKWSSQGNWIKKKQNKVTKNKSDRTKKSNQDEIIAQKKDVLIKKDILNNVPKEKVMEKYGIKKSTYYEKAKNIRQMRLEATENHTQTIVEQVYADLPDFLKKIAITKRNITIRIMKALNEESKSEEITILEKKMNLIMKTEKEIMRTGKLLTNYELLETEAQLIDENMQLEKLEIEKSKLKAEQVEDNKIEIKLVGI